MILPGIGVEGQKKISSAKVLIIGVGGLGSVASQYLVGAGVGTLGVVDCDNVDASNLHRQILYRESDIGQAKSEVAATRLKQLNSDVKIANYQLRINADNIAEILVGYDLVLDCTDNFCSRFLINDACVKNNKPLIHGALLMWEGQVTTIYPGKGPCYRCLFPDEPPPNIIPTCRESGVIGALAGIIGSLQAAEAIKLIVGMDDLLIGKLLTFNLKTNDFRKISYSQSKSCKLHA